MPTRRLPCTRGHCAPFTAGVSAAMAGSTSSTHAAMPSEIGARRDTQPDLSGHSPYHRDVILPHTEKRPRWNKRSRFSGGERLGNDTRSISLAAIYPSRVWWLLSNADIGPLAGDGGVTRLITPVSRAMVRDNPRSKMRMPTAPPKGSRPVGRSAVIRGHLGVSVRVTAVRPTHATGSPPFRFKPPRDRGVYDRLYFGGLNS